MRATDGVSGKQTHDGGPVTNVGGWRSPAPQFYHTYPAFSEQERRETSQINEERRRSQFPSGFIRPSTLARPVALAQASLPPTKTFPRTNHERHRS